MSEAWLSGPVAGVPALLQPAAHALLQAREDVESLAPTVSTEKLWAHYGGATAAFHLVHMAGALDRLFTYARGESLSDVQKAAARAEAEASPELDGTALVAIVNAAIEKALAQLRATDPSTLTHDRKVGRLGLPSTVIGALFHGAEHTTRHAGQFVTTVKLIASR